MATYYITILVVAGLCFLAEYYDYRTENIITIQTVHHTRATLFLFVLAMLYLAFVTGSRYFIGTDFGYYYEAYFKWTDLWDMFVNLKEPGFYFCSVFAREIWDKPQANILCSSAVIIFCSLIAIYRNTDKLTLSTLLYALAGCWHMGFNGVRQSLAGGVYFLGFGYLRDRKFIKYSVVTVIAFLFHRSAIVLIAIYFLVNRRLDVKNLVILIIVMSGILVVGDVLFDVSGTVLDNDYSSTNEYAETHVNLLRVGVAVAPAVFFTSLLWNVQRQEIDDFYLNILIINAITSVITMFSAYLYRICTYTNLLAIIAIPELLKRFDEKDRRIIVPIMLILYFFFWRHDIVISNALNPFHWCW